MRIYFLVLAVLGLLLALHYAYPGVALGDNTQMRIIYLCLLLMLVGSGFTLNRTPRSKNIRHAIIWAAIIGGLMLAYALLRSFQ